MAMIRKCDKCGSEATGRYNGALDRMDFRCVSCGHKWLDKTLNQLKEDDAETDRRLSDV